MPSAPVLSFLHVAKTFRAGIPGCFAASRVLTDVTFRLRRGEIAVVSGGPGSGTTTVLLLAAGMLRPDRGAIWRAGGAARLVHPVSTTTLRAAITEVVREPPDLLLVELCDRWELAARSGALVDALARAAAWQGTGVLVAARPGDPLLDRPHLARRLRLHEGTLREEPVPGGARRIAEHH